MAVRFKPQTYFYTKICPQTPQIYSPNGGPSVKTVIYIHTNQLEN